ncbi:aldo/keto reductase [Pollutimonas bauzanensis]|uniref:Predicted oxidoreductase n=1 Tax=Pollutimonas bauzanensis TaxID=658167 RepID=A0A1M5WZC1_9BURK|nr:aldo/keto reductase [Pollutimonas bauzanensis]SHH92917.1 Predicted oxidoreductase [Pollutimonas bauzanensis]
MLKRPLGQSGIEIAPLVFGGNVFGWTVDQASSFTLLDRFVEQGLNAIDTADVYSAWAPGNAGGESETIIGDWLKRRGRRDDVVLISKVGMWEGRKGLSARNIEAAIEDSLRRMRTDYLDVYFAHVDDEDVPLEETLGAFSRLVAAGKARAIGASNYAPARVEAALSASAQRQLARYEVLEPLYNLYDRDEFESGLAGLAAEKKLGVICYFSLASGFLTGKYRSEADLAGSKRAGMLKKYFDARGQRILAALNDMARELAATPAQIALAWLIARPGVTAPIASATSVAQLDDILGAVRLPLSDAAMRKLDEASA